MFLRNVEDALTGLLNKRFDIPIIPDFDNGPEPQGEYGVFGITTINQVNRGQRSTWSSSSNVLTERFKIDFRILATVSFYGDGAYQNSFDAYAALMNMDSLNDLYHDSCISIVDATSIRRIPELRDTKYIDRATFDITMLIGFENLTDVDWFNIVGYEASFPPSNIQYQDYVPDWDSNTHN